MDAKNREYRTLVFIRVYLRPFAVKTSFSGLRRQPLQEICDQKKRRTAIEIAVEGRSFSSKTGFCVDWRRGYGVQ
jgi:hypothetical protein